jgi:flagellar protein FlaF
MAVAEIIGAAIGTMLLIIVAYLLVGNVLTTAEVVSNAQKDMTLLEATRLNTDISVTYEGIDSSNTTPALNFTVTNTGNQVISDFNHATVFTYSVGDTGHTGYRIYTYGKNNPGLGEWGSDNGAGHPSIKYYDNNGWHDEIIHPGQLDPGEKMWVLAYFNPDQTPTWFEFCTNNGVYASAYRNIT